MLIAEGMIPVPVSSAGSRTSIRMGVWVGEVGVVEGRVVFIFWGLLICLCLCPCPCPFGFEDGGRLGGGGVGGRAEHTSSNPHCRKLLPGSSLDQRA